MSQHRESGNDLPLRQADYYQMLRSQIDAENELTSNRVIWLLIAEAFFVGGFATLLNAQAQAKNGLFAGQQDLLFWLVPIAALLAALLALGAVTASIIRVRELQHYYQAYEERTGSDDTSTKAFPPLQDGPVVHWLTTVSLLGLPGLFVVLWAIILLKQMLSP